jgi:hypothetical protein
MFVLDDPVEETDWRDFRATVRGIVHDLGTSLLSLNSAAPAYRA